MPTAERQALREQIKKGLAQLQADGRNHYHPAEPEARRMKVGDTNRYAYNAQAIADEKEKIIVACEATRQEIDTGQLAPMIEQARKNLRPGRRKRRGGDLTVRRHRLWRRGRFEGGGRAANGRAGPAGGRQAGPRQCLRDATFSL